MTEAQAPKVCGVCGEVLHGLRDKTSGELTHIHAQEFLGVDHPAVPVDYDERSLNARCDFCGGPVALADRWYLEAADFKVMVIEGMEHNSRSGWSACLTCAPLVAKKDWPALIQRHLETMGGSYNAETYNFLRDVMLPALFQALEANTLEPIRPWRAGDEKSIQT